MIVRARASANQPARRGVLKSNMAAPFQGLDANLAERAFKSASRVRTRFSLPERNRTQPKLGASKTRFSERAPASAWSPRFGSARPNALGGGRERHATDKPEIWFCGGGPKRIEEFGVW